MDINARENDGRGKTRFGMETLSKTKLLWLIDPNDKNIKSYRISYLDTRFPTVL